MIQTLWIVIAILALLCLVLIGMLMGLLESMERGNYCDDYCPYKVKVERHEQ